MGKIRDLILKHREIILYIFFGAMTTLVNTAAYWLCFHVLGVPNVPSTAAAWILAVLFAFVTNKIWVFESRSFDRKTLMREVPSFFGARLATGLLDVGIMYVTVDVMKWNGMIWKLISNGIVIVLNYAASKAFIFKKRQPENGRQGAEKP